MSRSCGCVLALAVICLPVIIFLSLEADAQQAHGSPVDNVVNIIQKTAAKQGLNVITGIDDDKVNKDEKKDETKRLKKLQTSNPIAALVSALSSESLSA